MLADLKAYGGDLSSLPESMQQPRQFQVLPENWDAVLMFLRIDSQWRPTQSGVMGLDYGVLLGHGGLMELYGVKDRREVFEGVQVMEAKARQLINDKAKKEIDRAQQTASKGRR